MADVMVRAKEILDGLTLKEKIGQLNQEAFLFKDSEIVKERVRKGELGAIILATSATAGNDKQEKVYYEVIDEIQKTALTESRREGALSSLAKGRLDYMNFFEITYKPPSLC